MNIKSKKGFTLAEVLLALAIIGAIASVTIPDLIVSVSNKESVANVRKYQSILNGAITRYSLDNGCTGDLRICGLFDVDSITAWNALKTYFGIAKDCGVAAGEGCLAKGVTYKRLNGDNYLLLDNQTTRSKGVLIDGIALSFYDYAGNCINDNSRSNSGPMFNVCASLFVDINGQTGPNQVGRDLFAFYVTKQGIFPQGNSDDVSYSSVAGEPECDPAAALADGGYGYGCTAKILLEGAVNY